MKSILVEERENEQRAYNSLMVDHKSLGILSNELSVKIIRELAKNPGCALDIARSLKEHEQKIYYHIRKLEGAGIIKLLRSEKRFGMTANIYEAVSPVVATKLYEDGSHVKSPAITRPEIARLLNPFINKGKFDAVVVLGDTYSHGKYDMHSTEGVHAFDLAFLFGNYVSEITFPNYKFDTEISERELENNLILIGHPQTNMLIEKLNTNLPLFFDEADDWSIRSRDLSKKIRDPRAGVIIKMDNPFNPSKKILILGGRTRGTQSAILAFTKFSDMLIEKVKNKESFHLIVQGFDKDGDKIIDNVKFLE